MSGEVAGAIDQRVTIERREPARDALGGAEGDWMAVANLWAGIFADGNAAFVAGEAASASPRWRATVRAGADVRVGDRIVWRGRTLSVRAVREEGETWTIAVEEER